MPHVKKRVFRKYRRDNTRNHILRLGDIPALVVWLVAGIPARRERTVQRPFGTGFIHIRDPEKFTMDEVKMMSEYGEGVPLDLMPREFWWDENSGLPRFGEEMLGDDF